MTLLEVLEQTGGARATWNEYAIIVSREEWGHEDGLLSEGWRVRARDYLADERSPGNQRVVMDCLVEMWDEVNGMLAELGLPDTYNGWLERFSEL